MRNHAETHAAMDDCNRGQRGHGMCAHRRQFGSGAGSGPGFGGFGPGGFGNFGRGRGGRMRRGGMQVAILALLAEQPMHGYQIIQELATRSGGAWTPGAGSVYPALEQMEQQGLITGDQQDAKRVYSITDEGRKLTQQHSHGQSNAPWDEAAEASGPRVDLRQSVFALLHAAQQIGRTGTDEQIAKAVELVDQARKAVYLILAE